jgi:hypothetical protein
LYNRSFVSFVICLPAFLLITSSSSSSLAYGAYSLNSASFRMTVHADLSSSFHHLPSHKSVHFINVCILCPKSL